MQDHDALPSTDPATDSELSAAAEAPATGTNQTPEASSLQPDQPAAPANDAEQHPESDADQADEADDDGPAELDDPFSGSEDAQPVMLDGEEEEAEEDEPSLADLDWYILKVQSNREDSIRDTLLRRISMQGMDRWFGEVVVPKEQVTEFKSGKKRVVWRKLYPGYILVHMVLNDETWFLVRETGGIGDFTGSGGKPTALPQKTPPRRGPRVDETSDRAIKTTS